VSAIVSDGGERYAACVDMAAAGEPLPFDFLEFLTQRLDVDRSAAAALVCAFMRAAWELGSHTAG
jgi:hypothetical protein